MDVELRVEHVGGADEAEIRALFGPHGFVSAVSLGAEDVQGVPTSCARVTFQTRTAADASAAALAALAGARIGGGATAACVDFAPPERLEETAPADGWSGGAPGSALHSPLGAGDGTIFASPLRRGSTQPVVNPPVPPASVEQQAYVPTPAAGSFAPAQPTLGAGSYAYPVAGAPPAPPVTAYGAGGYAYAPPQPADGAAYAPAQPAVASGAEPTPWQPGTSRLAFGTDQGRFLQESLAQRAGAGPNPYRARKN
ncbi:hypothetical protein T492DRAFT_1098301 [Pavlovales sp. CCMP2436]|nr:hypothetical protein T492DRAFT_1098301 [Pavlovales sp. CCMP2436]